MTKMKHCGKNKDFRRDAKLSSRKAYADILTDETLHKICNTLHLAANQLPTVMKNHDSIAPSVNRAHEYDFLKCDDEELAAESSSMPKEFSASDGGNALRERIVADEFAAILNILHRAALARRRVLQRRT